MVKYSSETFQMVSATLNRLPESAPSSLAP
jgi:hypothetical protein